MKWVKVLTPFSVASSGVAFKAGQVVEVSDELAKRHGEDGTGYLQMASQPQKAVKSAKKAKVGKSTDVIEPEKPIEPIQEEVK